MIAVPNAVPPQNRAEPQGRLGHGWREFIQAVECAALPASRHLVERPDIERDIDGYGGRSTAWPLRQLPHFLILVPDAFRAQTLTQQLKDIHAYNLIEPMRELRRNFLGGICIK